MTMTAADGPLRLEGRPTAQVIADYLREQIVQGTYRPGQQINESVLAGQLQTSRGPLREALQRLCQEGLLVSLRNRGVFVLELTTEDVKEIYSVRESLELSSADALLGGDPLDVDDTCRVLEGIIKDMVKQVAAADWQAMARLDMQFHTSFVAGAKNGRLIRIYKTLAAETRMCLLSLEVSCQRADVLVGEHQRILDGLEARDRAGLHRAIKEHLREAVEDLTGVNIAATLVAEGDSLRS